MSSVGRFTHAVVARVPQSFQTLPSIDGTCIDLERAKEQQEVLVKCLRGLNIDVLEMPPDEPSPPSVYSETFLFRIFMESLSSKTRFLA